MACIARRRDRYVLDFYDNEGNRIRKTLAKGTTKAQAKEALRKEEDAVSKGIYLHEKKTPLFSEVARAWIEQKRPNLRESTWEVYDGHVRLKFKDLDNLKINRITTPVIEKYITTRQNQGMHILTLRKTLVSLNQIMAYAVRHKYIDHNSLHDAERPRTKGTEEDQKTIVILSPEQIQALLDVVTEQKYHTLFMLAFMSGARQGELLGLKWSDLDRTNNQLHIRRSFNTGKFFDTKTKTSRRKIDLGPKIMQELRLWKMACPANDFDLMFPNEAGQPMNHSNMVQRYFQTALKDAGLPRMRFHDVRHTYASLLIEQGANIKYIQNQLGHSSPMVTLSVYAHLMKDAHPEEAQRLEETIFNTTGHNLVTGRFPKNDKKL